VLGEITISMRLPLVNRNETIKFAICNEVAGSINNKTCGIWFLDSESCNGDFTTTVSPLPRGRGN
jgi:hypothetical protein